MSKTDTEKAKRWQKRPPISGMSIEEMQARVKAGIKNRQATGEMMRSDLTILKTSTSGPVLTKQHKRTVIAATNLAIYSLANNEREDYCGAADVIRRICRQSGHGNSLFGELLKGCAETAAELAGEDFHMMDQLARHWLANYFTPSGKLISITKGHDHGNTEEKTHDHPGATPGNSQKPKPAD